VSGDNYWRDGLTITAEAMGAKRRANQCISRTHGLKRPYNNAYSNHDRHINHFKPTSVA